jgi:hypothetical protein
VIAVIGKPKADLPQISQMSADGENQEHLAISRKPKPVNHKGHPFDSPRLAQGRLRNTKGNLHQGGHG